LLVDGETTPVETQYKQNTEAEILFYYQNVKPRNTRSRQLQIDTSTSKYQLLNYESYFKIDDRFKRPYSENTGNSAMFVMGNVLGWWTRGKGYGFNRVTGVEVDIFGASPRTGPDGKVGSAFAKNGNVTFTSSNPIDGKVVHAVSNEETIPLGWELAGVIDGWNVLYRDDLTGTGFDLSAVYGLFDVRVLDTDKTTYLTIIPEYINKLETFLPRY
jgi:hypothetical protein